MTQLDAVDAAEDPPAHRVVFDAHSGRLAGLACLPGSGVTAPWRHRWRTPMLAAAAVVAVVVTAITATTLGAQHGGGAAAPGPVVEGPATDAGVTVDGLVFAHHPDQGGGDTALLTRISTQPVRGKGQLIS